MAASNTYAALVTLVTSSLESKAVPEKVPVMEGYLKNKVKVHGLHAPEVKQLYKKMSILFS